MASHKVSSSFTEAKLKQFILNASEGEVLQCTKISGFQVYKNRAQGSASFRYKPTSRNSSRSNISIGRTNILKINEAAQVALKMVEALNNGEDPKSVLRRGQVVPASHVLAISKDDLSILGNFFEKVYMPARRRQSGDAAHDNYTIIIREFSHLFNKSMSKITSKDITDWQDKKEKQGLTHITIVRYYAVLVSMLSMAVRLSQDSGGEHAGLLYEMPFKYRPLRGASKAQRDALLKQEQEIDIHVRRMLGVEELLKIERAMERYADECAQQRERSRQHANRMHLPCLKNVTFPHWILPYIYIAYYTGLRPGDISDLKWEDFHSGRLSRATNKSKHLAKPVVVKLSLSNSKSVFKYSLAEVISLWREQQGSPQMGWVFPQIRDESKPLSEKGYKKSWAKITEYAGLKLHMYSFRHNFISKLIREGMNMKLVATMSGHKTTEMIERHYAHHFPSDIEEAMNVF